MAIAVGDVVEGVVTGITKFGAFVKLDEKTVGLVHISELSLIHIQMCIRDSGYGFIKDPPDNIFFHYTSLENKDFNALKVGEKVRLTVKTTQDGKVQADQVWVLE